MCILPYADWTLHQRGGFCKTPTWLGNASSVQDCLSLAEQRGLQFASYYDNITFKCDGSPSCDAVVNISGWTIYHLGNVYQSHKIYRITYYQLLVLSN